MKLTLYFIALAINATLAAADDSLRVEPLDIPARFVVSLISDGCGGAFIGTEDHGVYHYSQDGRVKRYTTKDGLGDNNAYALTIDNRGRLWVGHLNTGVSVFNGETWRNYDVIDGPIGERIFDLQTCPVDGDVWLATSAGITRYKSESDRWEHFTREDGLLEDQAASLAFKNDGTLIVGTQCHGLAVFTRSKTGEYKHTKDITAPERFGQNNCSPVPLTPFGTGLPTNQINQVLVARDGVVWIATPTGLVRADSSLKTMTYVRGSDYADKVRGLYGGAPKDWQECPPEVMETLLPEDYITCLAEDAGGAIWIGTRLKGVMAIDPKTGRRGTGDQESFGIVDNYISAILPMPDSRPLLGLYIGGVARPNRAMTLSAAKKTRTVNATVNTIAKSNFAPLPSPIKPPTLEELKAMQAKLEKLNKPLPKVYAAYYGEDWKTQGDWVGRYGRQYAILCAMQAPFDRDNIVSDAYYKTSAFLGPHRTEEDSLRYWVHWLKTDNQRSLWDPLNGCRRQSEWDDHGEEYPMTMDGPDLWTLIDIRHPGVFQIDLYFFNKDGHRGQNRIRDYTIEVYPCAEGLKTPETNNDNDLSEISEALVLRMPPLCKSRVKDFWGGSYKSFIVSGSAKYLIKVDRNYSFNTILSMVGIERLSGDKTGDEAFGLPLLHYVNFDPPSIKPRSLREESRISEVLWNSIDSSIGKQRVLFLQRKYRIRIYQMLAEHCGAGTNEGESYLAARFLLNQWNENIRLSTKAKLEKAHHLLLENVDGLKEALKGRQAENVGRNGMYEFFVIPMYRNGNGVSSKTR